MGKPKRRVRRRRRERMPSSLRLGILISVLVFIVIASGILMVPALNVSEVYCEGCNNTNPTDIISAAGIETGGNILLANVGRAEREIGKMSLVEEVSVRRVFPDKICITVTERIPAAYIMKGGECAAIDKDGIVLEVINDARVATIVKNNTPQNLIVQEETTAPEENAETEQDGEGETTEDTTTETTENAESTENAEVTESAETTEDQGLQPKIYPIPLAYGVELENAKEGKGAKAADKEKFEKLLEICNALNEAGLLNRTTCIDVSNMTDVKIYIENRLEVQLGAADNIEYRARFLSEVVNTKISATEKAIMDYRNDDIYVRSPEDGKARTVQPEEEAESDEEADGEEVTEEETEEETEESDNREDINVTL